MTDDEKELLKTGTDALVKPFGDLMQKLFGGPFEEIGGMWQDSLRVRRQVRQAKLLTKLQSKIAEAKFEPMPIPDKIWMPLIQAALAEDDDTIQDKWASLLANAADPREVVSVLPSFATILGELTPRDARFLDAIVAYLMRVRGPRNLSNVALLDHDLQRLFEEAGLAATQRIPRIPSDPITDDHVARRQTDLTNCGVTLTTMLRNGLVREINTSQYAKGAKPKIKSRSNPTLSLSDVSIDLPDIRTQRVYHLSDLGVAFIRACQAPSGEGESG